MTSFLDDDPAPTALNLTHTGDDYAYALACCRGDHHDAPGYHITVQSCRWLLPRFRQTDPDAATEIEQALTEGDQRWPDDRARHEPLYEPPDIDIDPLTTAAFDAWDPTADEADHLATHRNNGHHPDNQPTSLLDRLHAATMTTDAIRALPPPAWLIDGYLIRNSLALLYGPSGTYKTFLGVDLALHIATGSWWNGRQITDRGNVLYVIAEGVAGVGSRIDAWQQHHKIYQLDNYQPITWLPRAINLADPLQAATFAQLAGRLEPALIVIDTLARCTLGAEENSARDMGAVVEHLDQIRRATGACVLSIHHTGKDTTGGARGSSALRAAMDTELELRPDPLELKVTKQKDAPETGRLQLAPLPVHLTEDVSSLVLVPTGLIAQGDAIGASDGLVLDALRDIMIPGGVPSGTWEKAAGVAPRTFYRARGRLVGRGIVINLGTEKQARYAPAKPPEDDDLEEF